jgi:hypothetical protein
LLFTGFTVNYQHNDNIYHLEKEKGKNGSLRPHTPKHIRGGWSHYTDTSEQADGYGAQNMVTVQTGFSTSDLLITGTTR